MELLKACTDAADFPGFIKLAFYGLLLRQLKQFNEAASVNQQSCMPLV
jgi:hypothetical protein